MVVKEKKSFKKYAAKHLSTIIEARRKGAKAKKEKLERVERRTVREQKQAAREEKEHLDQLDKLKDTDPQFYSYLEEEDPTLLQFGQNDIDVVDDNDGSDAETDADEDEEGNEDEAADEKQEEVLGRITRAELTSLIAQKKMDPLVDIFLSAAKEMGYSSKAPQIAAPSGNSSSRRKFEDPGLVKESLLKVIQCVGQNLSQVVNSKGSVKSPKMRSMMKRFLKCLVQVLSESGDTDSGLSAGLLHALVPFVPILHFVHGLTKSVLKTALILCSNQEERIRLAAYVVVRAVATRASGTRSLYQSTAFKGVFLALVRAGHQYTIHNLPIIGFLMSCVVDLYGTDVEAAYQHAFVYQRQLAVYLRAALQQQSQSNVRAVFNWQYVNALRTWGLVVSTYAEPTQLGALIHPTVQIALGIMDLFSSPRMFPMHLHVIEMLNLIANRADGVYVPLAPYLLRILTSSSLALTSHKDGASSGKRPRDGGVTEDDVDMRFLLRTKKSHVKSSVYKLAVWTEALYLLTEHLATHSNSIGFPEAFWAVEATLKKLKKEIKVPKINAQVSTISRHMEATNKMILRKREGVNFGPCDLTAIKLFEDELRVQKSGNALVDYYRSLRKNRVNSFAEKQQEVSNKDKGRTTLDSVVAERAGKKGRKESH